MNEDKERADGHGVVIEEEGMATVIYIEEGGP